MEYAKDKDADVEKIDKIYKKKKLLLQISLKMHFLQKNMVFIYVIVCYILFCILNVVFIVLKKIKLLWFDLVA